MCMGAPSNALTGPSTMDPDLRQAHMGAAVTSGVPIKGQSYYHKTGPGRTLDSDLQDAYKSNTQMVRMREVYQEQDRRDAARAEMKRLSTEREAAISQQIADSQRMQQEMANQTVAQQEKVNALREEQATKLGTIRAAGTAVTQSLRILGQSGGKQAPTAAMSSKPKVARRARTSTASLRMGSTSQGTGSGANLSV
jgi:hypothetical protein